MPDEESDEHINAACRRTSDVVDRIETIHATTLEGLCLKALAVSWCYSSGPIEFDDNPTTDLRLAQSIIRDILAMAASGFAGRVT